MKEPTLVTVPIKTNRPKEQHRNSELKLSLRALYSRYNQHHSVSFALESKHFKVQRQNRVSRGVTREACDSYEFGYHPQYEP